MQQEIKAAASKFLEDIKDKSIGIISHFDTDGITAAAIMSKSLTRLRKRFSVKIIKQIEPSVFKEIKDDVILFLDLGSSSLERISKLGKIVYVIDHHEITDDIPENITLLNPRMYGSEEVSGAGLAYLFCRELGQNKDLASLAVIGMVGDTLDREISKLNNEILKDAEVFIKKGLMLYPATRPINKSLEYGSGLYIPGVTGNARAVFEMLNEAGIKKEGLTYKSLIDLTEEEMSRLITSVLLRKQDSTGVIGNIYLIKFFNKLEDARGLSAMINACSRLGNSEIALALCLNNKTAKERAEEIYTKYKQQLVTGLGYVEQNKHIGKGYVIVNAKDRIKDTIIGTVMSIVSNSQVYEKGTVLIGLAYDQDKIKISARVCGREGRNVRQVLESATKDIPETECGGHPLAAGCLISKDYEKSFMNEVVKTLDLEVVKI